MPFHGHYHSANVAANPPGTATGIYQASQTLGSIGAPSGNLRVATSGTTSYGTDAFLPSTGGQTAPPSSTGLPGPNSSVPLPAPASGLPNSAHQYETPRRTHNIGRHPEEQHIPNSSQGMGQYVSQPTSQQPTYSLPNEYSAGPAPNVSLQQATPRGSLFPRQTATSDVPGTLQPGSSQRPQPSTTYTAPSTVPTMPHISTNAQQYTAPSRPNAMNPSHSYSRSSPAGMEQKYIPFSSTPENTKHASTPNQKYFSPTTPSGAASSSPLGLSDIRPRANSELGNDSFGGSTLLNESTQTPTNSNYLAPWATYAYDWCKWPVHGGSSAGKMAVGSYLEDPHNFIQILDTQIVPQEVTAPGGPSYGLEFLKVAEATCAYPVTRILWEPPSSQKQSTDLLATSGDHLRLWSLPSSPAPLLSNTISRSSSVNTRDPPPQKLQPLALLSNSKTPEHTAPLTSLDWNTLSPKLIITSSIDTTCTIWDIPTLTAKTQLIAHDKEVFDVRFCAGSVDVFVSCGADGSVRMFDLRSLEHSTIIYEPSDKSDKDKGSPGGRMSPTKAQQTMSHAPPLLRLAASPHDSHLLATFAQDSSLIRILDVRQPGQALLELRGHSAALNSIEWCPSRRGMLASGADDSTVLLWDLINASNAAPAPSVNGNGTPALAGSLDANAKGPAASWRCDYEVGNVSWAPQSSLTNQGGDWIGVCGGRGIWGVKI
ncbi:hypothetical protein LTR60_001287 [Cryomyces antarcticus]|nr:hypothetical protein LTR60_001287 [Cryomyces antarcticus]